MTSNKTFQTTALFSLLLAMTEPAAARFLSPDPAPADEENFNRYWYANNNPYTFVDPDGRKPGDPFKTRRDAAKDAITHVNPRSISENKEYAGALYRVGSTHYATEAAKGDEIESKPFANIDQMPKDGVVEGDYHTHGNYSVEDESGEIVVTGDPKRDDFDSENFSEEDKLTSHQAADIGKTGNYAGYVGTPSGKIKEYDVQTLKTEEFE